MVKKVYNFILIFVVANIVCSTVWLNYFDPQMLYLQNSFQKEDYGRVRALKVEEVKSDGIEEVFSGGIFFLRDVYLKENGYLHQCRWIAHEYTMEPRFTNTFCLFFWLPLWYR